MIDRAQTVPVDEALNTLRISAGFTPASPGWIRVKKGLYKDDLAFIKEVEPQSLRLTAAVVPRIGLEASKGKGKRKASVKQNDRPPRQLFNEALIRNVFGVDSVDRRNRVCIFRNKLYRNGLLDITLDRYQFHPNAIPTNEELELFCRSDIDVGVLAHAYDLAGRGALKPGDQVKIMSQPHNGLIGSVRAVNGDEIDVDIGSLPLSISIRADHVRKSFQTGDEVKVMTGAYVGLTGWVVGIGRDNARLEICEHTSKTIVRDLGA
jgi:transcription elongation factor SPT5